MHILQKRPRNALSNSPLRSKKSSTEVTFVIPTSDFSLNCSSEYSKLKLPYNSVDIFSLHFPKIPHDPAKKMLSSSWGRMIVNNFISMEDNSFVGVFYVSYFLIFQSIIPRGILFLEKAGLFGCRLHAMASEWISYVYNKFYFTYSFLW